MLDILCAPGFSTREEADRGSGRGVGMAVVRTTVQELGGSMTLDSVPGQGTRFTIELPLTLAITDALIALVGDQTFAVPQAAVREVIEVDPAAVRMLENNEIAPHRGGALPLVRLAAVFVLEARPRHPLHVFVIGAGHAALASWSIASSASARSSCGRSRDPLIRVDGISGATDLGDGRVVLILDLPRCSDRAGAASSAASARPRSRPGAADRECRHDRQLHPLHRRRHDLRARRARTSRTSRWSSRSRRSRTRRRPSTAWCSRAARSCRR